MTRIKRGVSLYSYQHEYAHGTFTLEDAIAAAAKVGALGIETLGEQMIPGFPFPGQLDLPDSFYARWKDLIGFQRRKTRLHGSTRGAKRAWRKAKS